MEKGSLMGHGARWKNNVIKKGFLDVMGDVVVAYKCPQCKKIELVAE